MVPNKNKKTKNSVVHFQKMKNNNKRLLLFDFYFSSEIIFDQLNSLSNEARMFVIKSF